jgi:anti-sigma factor RsiW
VNCHFLHQLAPYLDDELPSPQRVALAEHIKTCAVCESQLQALQQEQTSVRGALNSYPRIQAAPDFDLRVLASVSQRQSRLDVFFDRIDAFFARPLPKLLGSSVMGLFCGALILFALLPSPITSENATTVAPGAKVPAMAARERATVSRFYAQNRFRGHVSDAELLKELGHDIEDPATRRAPATPPKTPGKEPSWDVDISASPLSALPGSLC